MTGIETLWFVAGGGTFLVFWATIFRPMTRKAHHAWLAERDEEAKKALWRKVTFWLIWVRIIFVVLFGVVLAIGLGLENLFK